jgi:hypothetical protein
MRQGNCGRAFLKLLEAQHKMLRRFLKKPRHFHPLHEISASTHLSELV